MKPFTHLAISSVFFILLSGCFSRRPQTTHPNHPPRLESAHVEHWVFKEVSEHPSYGSNFAKGTSLSQHLEATLQHLSMRKKLPPTRTEPSPDREQMMQALAQLQSLAEQPTSLFWKGLEEHFLLLTPVSREKDPAFFTGYYTPIYHGSKTSTKNFRYPVYAAPKDLKTNPGNYTREAIDRRGLLIGKGLEICYLASPLDVLLLQVQGSGTVHLEDGSSLGLGFAGHNDQPYTSLGKVLIQEGIIPADQISLNAIKKAYRADPIKVDDLILRNPRYIFFRQSDGKPRGSSGAVVRAFHSIATERFSDRTYRFPAHIPAWLTLDLPHHNDQNLLALCQDTGSAIRGDLRADIYLGHGSSAEKVAGELKHTGQFCLLWHRNWPRPVRIGKAPVKSSE